MDLFKQLTLVTVLVASTVIWACEESTDTVPVDSIPPKAPFLLSTRYVNQKIILLWEMDSTLDVVRYVIEKGTWGDTSSIVDFYSANNRDDRMYIDEDIELNKRYFYRVGTEDNAGNRATSSIITGSAYAKFGFHVGGYSPGIDMTLDSDGENLYSIITEADKGTWSPDYSKIYFKYGSRFFILDYSLLQGAQVSDGIIEMPDGLPTFHAWSGSSERILFFDEHNAKWVSSDGNVVTEIPIPADHEYHSPSLSKTNDLIVCSDHDFSNNNSTPDIILLDEFGTEQLRYYNSSIGESFVPKLSNDGTRILFMATAPYEHGTRNLFLINSDGTGLNQVTDYWPANSEVGGWSPDDSYIFYYLHETDKPTHVIIRNMATGTEYDLTGEYPQLSHLAWIDDIHLVITNGYDYPDLIVLAADGSDAETIYTFESPYSNPSGLTVIPN